MLPCVRHTVRVLGSGLGASAELRLENVVDISGRGGDTELAMRIETGVNNGGLGSPCAPVAFLSNPQLPSGRVFFTDANGFQMQRRETLEKLPTGGNFFPLPSMAVLPGEGGRRFVVHAAQTHGCASLEPGWFEVVLDRRLTKDDSRGLFYAMQDQRPSASTFALAFERVPDEGAAFNPTAAAFDAGDRLNLPLRLYVPSAPLPAASKAHISPLGGGELPPAVHLLSFKTLAAATGGGGGDIAVLLHRRVCAHDGCPDGAVDIKAAFSSVGRIARVREVSLSLMHELDDDVKHVTQLAEREVQAFRLEVER